MGRKNDGKRNQQIKTRQTENNSKYILKMKTKLISMQWRGSASVDPRFSAAMLPWTIADIYSYEQYTNVSKSEMEHNFTLFSPELQPSIIQIISIAWPSD